MKSKYLSPRTISVIAIMSAISAILMVIDFPISFIAPSFYKLDISDLPCLIGTFSLGPLAGVIIELLKVLIKLIIKPTSTAFVGEFANFICGISLCIPAGIIYKKNHTKRGALRAIIIGVISLTIIGSMFNYFIMLPFYESFFNFPMEQIIAAGSAIVPIIKDKFSFVLLCVVPFNLLKGVIVGLSTYLLYKRISPIISHNK